MRVLVEAGRLDHYRYHIDHVRVGRMEGHVQQRGAKEFISRPS